MLDAVITWDEKYVYDKLLNDCADLLTPDESGKLKADSIRLFDFLLPPELYSN